MLSSIALCGTQQTLPEPGEHHQGLCDGAAGNASQIDSFFITEQLEYAQCAAVKEDLRIKALIVSGALLSIIMCAVSWS